MPVSHGVGYRFWWPNQGGLCNTLASAYMSFLEYCTQAAFGLGIELTPPLIGLVDVGGFWGISVTLNATGSEWNGEKVFVGMDAPTDRTMPAQQFVLPISGIIKTGAQVFSGDPGGAEVWCNAITQSTLELILSTVTDAESLEWTSRTVDVLGGIATRTIATGVMENETGPIMLALSFYAAASETGDFVFLGGGSDAPAMMGGETVYPVVPVYSLVEPISAITDQDAEVSINQGAAAYSIKAKVVATP